MSWSSMKYWLYIIQQYTYILVALNKNGQINSISIIKQALNFYYSILKEGLRFAKNACGGTITAANIAGYKN